MKKLIASLAFVITSFGVSAQVEEWTVLSGHKDPKEVIAYTIIPSTVESIQTKDGMETWAVVEIFLMADQENITRRRVRLIGCPIGTGKITLANMDGSFIKENPVWEWDKSGNKVYDIIAVQTCVAEYAKKKQPEMKKQSSQGPNV